jgi:magnesium-transporting ATPase (P-type)
MYYFVLALHSLVRWFVLAGLLFALYRGYSGWLGRKHFGPTDNFARIFAATIAHTQLVIGLVLYVVSPIVHYFLHNFKIAVHERNIRFFGMEHITMMLIAIVLITIGSIRAKRKELDQEKFKTMAIWFTIALLIILLSIPWAFSPLTSRPSFRPF